MIRLHGELGLRGLSLASSSSTYRSQPHTLRPLYQCSRLIASAGALSLQHDKHTVNKHLRGCISQQRCQLDRHFLAGNHSDAFWRKIHSQSCSRHKDKVEPLPGIKAQLPKPVTNFRERAAGYLRESLLLSYSALFDNVIFRAAEWLQLDKLLKWLTPHLEDGYAAVTGLAHHTCSVAAIPCHRPFTLYFTAALLTEPNHTMRLNAQLPVSLQGRSTPWRMARPGLFLWSITLPLTSASPRSTQRQTFPLAAMGRSQTARQQHRQRSRPQTGWTLAPSACKIFTERTF